jgi:hypothetical protein
MIGPAASGDVRWITIANNDAAEMDLVKMGRVRLKFCGFGISMDRREF